jgi:hypothetical protein
MAEAGKLTVSYYFIHSQPQYATLLFRIVFTSWATSHPTNIGVINFLA